MTGREQVARDGLSRAPVRPASSCVARWRSAHWIALALRDDEVGSE
jgi:hypothetical protein